MLLGGGNSDDVYTTRLCARMCALRSALGVNSPLQEDQLSHGGTARWFLATENLVKLVPMCITTVDNAIVCEMVIPFATAMVNCCITVPKIVFKKVCNDGMKLNHEGRSRYPKWHYALDHH